MLGAAGLAAGPGRACGGAGRRRNARRCGPGLAAGVHSGGASGPSGGGSSGGAGLSRFLAPVPRHLRRHGQRPRCPEPCRADGLRARRQQRDHLGAGVHALGSQLPWPGRPRRDPGRFGRRLAPALVPCHRPGCHGVRAAAPGARGPASPLRGRCPRGLLVRRLLDADALAGHRALRHRELCYALQLHEPGRQLRKPHLQHPARSHAL
mmetsp:Transcript_9990/g.27930  ORF Transcript_9990/g.27930 Transcript_9990/m.27930 type:complete len:208 (+) Transcript_9990:712-1335(+)